MQIRPPFLLIDFWRFEPALWSNFEILSVYMPVDGHMRAIGK
jgi:hypothetical protein